MRSKRGQLESPTKAKSRINKFESNLECGHRLALTYASNQPEDTPKLPTDTIKEGKELLKFQSKVKEQIKSGHLPGPPKDDPATLKYIDEASKRNRRESIRRQK